ncbi:MAG: alanine dehydrogenase [Gammaproteobacteria bacterium]|nr:alanine dehydrogenase [Gammaproteobacteria bacterium]MBQ0840019.1 alanine dehydrogenase [Gammaproteobacteria bacterium]
MRIGVIKETKVRENRVALTPQGTLALVENKHQVVVEQGAGLGSGFSDQDYQRAGGQVVSTAQAWASDLILKVKEPQASEYCYLKQQIVFTYFHLAGAAPALTKALLASLTTAIAYETVEDASGGLPLLAPMSAVAGSMAVTIGNYYLARFNNGKGMLLAKLFDERFGKVVIVGDGVVGLHAARVADSLGAEVYLCGRHPERLDELHAFVSSELHFVLSSADNIAAELEDTDLLIGAVLQRGGRAPHLVSEAMVRQMQPGSVIVDVSIDQGGCIETMRATTHDDPVYEKHGVIHYGVTNMPGAYPRLSTMALTRATLPYILKLADRGLAALDDDPGFAQGLNTYDGEISCQAVAEALALAD